MTSQTNYPVFSHLNSPTAVYWTAGETSEARNARAFREGLIQSAANSHALSREALLQMIRTAALDASSQDWDGHGSAAANAESVSLANKTARKIPFYIPDPSVDIDPDGEVSMHWKSLDTGSSILIGFNSNGLISYSALHPPNESSHGSIKQKDNRLPKQVLIEIGRLLGSGDQ